MASFIQRGRGARVGGREFQARRQRPLLGDLELHGPDAGLAGMLAAEGFGNDLGAARSSVAAGSRPPNRRVPVSDEKNDMGGLLVMGATRVWVT